MSCTSDPSDYQIIRSPKTGFKNLSLAQLCQKLSNVDHQATTYGYIIATIDNRNGQLIQYGSGPNFQGDRLTLCTCKHYMRTFRASADWPGVWIAGFTGKNAGGGRNALVYLVQVGQAYDSQADLWLSPQISARTKQAKLASRHRLGDLFQPNKPGDPFDPQTYELPHSQHSHIEGNHWFKDVDYRRSGRPAALLVGDPHHTFVWDKPLISYSTRLHRGQKRVRLGEMLGNLREEIDA